MLSTIGTWFLCISIQEQKIFVDLTFIFRRVICLLNSYLSSVTNSITLPIKMADINLFVNSIAWLMFFVLYNVQLLIKLAIFSGGILLVKDSRTVYQTNYTRRHLKNQLRFLRSIRSIADCFPKYTNA